jgi:hypothetical protein
MQSATHAYTGSPAVVIPAGCLLMIVPACCCLQAQRMQEQVMNTDEE